MEECKWLSVPSDDGLYGSCVSSEYVVKTTTRLGGVVTKVYNKIKLHKINSIIYNILNSLIFILFESKTAITLQFSLSIGIAL